MSNEILKALDSVESKLVEFKTEQAVQADRMLQIEQKGFLRNDGAEGTHRTAPRFETVNGVEVKHFARGELLAKAYHSATEDFSLGQFVRDNILGTKAASSNALVPTAVSAQIIDKVRARATVIEAGASTIVIGGPTNMARLLSDPVVTEHTEGAADVTETDITFSAVNLNPKTLMATIPLTLELVADSPNLDDLLSVALSNAFAAKFDSLAIALMLADTAIPTSSASQSNATWAGVLAAVTQALGLNQALPLARISTTGDFMARAGQLASTAGSWLGAPPVLAAMRDLFTTGMTADRAIFGDFAEGLAIALRQALQVEVVRFGKPGSGSHLLVATMRAAAVVTQPGRLFIQKTTVV